MSDIDIDIIKQEVLSLLVSAKYGLTERDLLDDYRRYNSNKDLPYKELGFPSLVLLLRSWPDVCRIQQQGNNGPIKFLAVEEESTKHILSMVKGQREGKSRRRARGGHNRGRGRGQHSNRDNHDARFSEHAYDNRSRGNARGASNTRLVHNNNRFERSNASSQHSKTRGNISASPRFAKQQSQTRPYGSGSVQPSFSSRQTINFSTAADRQVINDSASLRITFNNAATDNDIQQSPNTPQQFLENEINEEEYQYDEEVEDVVINNLRTLLTQYPYGVRLLALDNLYKEKFGKSLLAELKITNILLLQDIVDDFACILRREEADGSCDHIITLKDPKQVEQTQAHALQQITDSGIVPSTFRYANNLFTYINDPRFQGFVSEIDKNEHCMHIQPVRYQEHIETLMEELDSYYSSTQSNALIIKDLEAGLSCVTQYDHAYHRVFIKETDLYRCVIVYIDYGTVEEINKEDRQFKYLLNHFAELPCMAIACRLDDVYFLPDDTQWAPDTYKEVYQLCKNTPFFIEPTGRLNGLLTIRIFDADNRSLNDLVIEWNLAVRLSQMSNNEQARHHGPKPVQLTFEILDHAVQCPLPNSDPSTPESNTTNAVFQFPNQTTSTQTNNHLSNTEHRCKLVPIDEINVLCLIRHTNDRPHIPCFNLAQLLHASELDILSQTLLSRTRLQLTDEYRSVYDFYRQRNLTDCLHIHQNFLFVFDLISTMKFIEQLTLPGGEILVEALREHVHASSNPQFWKNDYEYRKSSTNQSTDQKNIERYNELLERRNILCNMLRTDDIHACSLQLESIENELQTLIEQMRAGAPPQQNTKASLSNPPGFSTTIQSNRQLNSNDKLKDLMERCKKLINTILILNDYVDVDDNVTNYIQTNLAYLGTKKKSSQDEQLKRDYSDFLENLTLIVNDLQRQLPLPVSY
ncbi:unnamed protein product [Adineta ricciae]|uniref:HTH OST-type domain-containing protein n=1 Tax=Adineta ricciae TaxID=249248 RepID=A0A814VW02_ADIRI|nr:unnamed protein product [Adineta ricciae]